MKYNFTSSKLEEKENDLSFACVNAVSVAMWRVDFRVARCDLRNGWFRCGMLWRVFVVDNFRGITYLIK